MFRGLAALALAIAGAAGASGAADPAVPASDPSRLVATAAARLRQFVRSNDPDRLARGFDADACLARHASHVPLLFSAFRDRYGVRDAAALEAPSEPIAARDAAAHLAALDKGWDVRAGLWETPAERAKRSTPSSIL